MMSPAKASSSSSALRQEAHHRVRPQLLARARDLEPHAALEVARGDAHEGDAVAVRRVHVGLDLEHHAAELGLVGLHQALHRRARRRRRREVDQRVEHLLDAEIVDRRAEEHRRLAAGQEFGLVERRCRGLQQLDVVVGMAPFGAEALAIERVVQALEHLVVVALPVFARREHPHALLAQIHHAVEVLAHADRPGERHHLHAEFALDLLHQRQRLLHFAVHLVDEGDDGRVAQAADFEQLDGLRLDALGGVDHHHRRIHRGQHAVGVFRKVLVAGRIEQVDDAIAVFHLHHARCHRDAALLLDLHPVGGGMAAGLARLDRARDLDRAREQQQLLGQRGLARVGVRNDREGAAAAHLAGEGCGHGGRRAQPSGAPACKGADYRCCMPGSWAPPGACSHCRVQCEQALDSPLIHI